jgi:superoxide reductase
MEQGQIFKCSICGNIVELLHVGGGQLVCCGQPMDLQKENTVDASLEKHVPVVEDKGGEWLVKIGAIAHPMEEAHYIEWVEIKTANGVCKKYFRPGETPEIKVNEKVLSARAYCNIHGLWKSKE